MSRSPLSGQLTLWSEEPPCQSFSIAGLRGGLADARGNLALRYCQLLAEVRPRWFVWENVPGVLSSNKGRDFGTIVSAMAELGYGWAYRVLDAQFFGVPQRRRRVFIVGHLGDWRRSAAVLFEPESLRGNSAAGRKAGKDVAGTLASRTSASGGLGTDFDIDGGVVTHTLRGEGFDASEDGTGRGVPLISGTLGANHGNIKAEHAWTGQLVSSTGHISHCLNAGGMGRIDYETETMVSVFDTTQITSPGNYSSPKPGDPSRPLCSTGHVPAIAFSCKDHAADAGDLSPTLRAMGHGESHANAGGQVAVCTFQPRIGRSGRGYSEGVVGALAGADAGSTSDMRPCVAGTASGVRRLTPVECERLQGFPDNYTLVPHRSRPAADGPRYKALGNSMAVPVMTWIGRRIELINRR